MLGIEENECQYKKVLTFNYFLSAAIYCLMLSINSLRLGITPNWLMMSTLTEVRVAPVSIKAASHQGTSYGIGLAA